jgi:hypothetical protein
MSKTFTLTQTSPESDIFTHRGGRITVLCDGTFDGSSLNLQLRANNVGFIQLTNDDFNITSADVFNVNLPAYSEYKIIANSSTGSTNINVTIL